MNTLLLSECIESFRTIKIYEIIFFVFQKKVTENFRSKFFLAFYQKNSNFLENFGNSIAPGKIQYFMEEIRGSQKDFLLKF